MEYVILATGLVLIVAAWLCYKYPNLINPYGSLPPERKALVDIEGLKKAFAIISGVTGLLLVFTATLQMLKVIDEDVSGVTLMVLTFIMIVLLFIVMRRYNGFGRDRFGTIANPVVASKEPWVRATSKVTWIITGLPMVFVAIILVLSFRSPQITVEEETVKISGMYGREIPIADIISVDLLDEMPPIAQRTNGSDTGTQAKGHFKFKNGEKCMLFIHKKAPYIQLRTTSNLYYMNFSDREKTVELFETLKNLQP